MFKTWAAKSKQSPTPLAAICSKVTPCATYQKGSASMRTVVARFVITSEARAKAY
jgi:hypothetical protein